MKAIFLTRHIREKLLVIAILFAGIGYWGITLYGRTTAELANTKKLNADLKEQQDWLARKDQVETHLTDEIKQLDPKKAASVGTILSAVEKILGDLSIDTQSMGNSSVPQLVKSTLMTVSLQTITLNNLNMQDLLNVYRALTALTPFVDIEAVTLQVTNGRTPGNQRGGRAGANGAVGTTATFGGGATQTNARGGRGGRGANATIAAAGPGQPIAAPPPAVGSRLNAVFSLQGVSLPTAKAPRTGNPPARKPSATPAGATATTSS